VFLPLTKEAEEPFTIRKNKKVGAILLILRRQRLWNIGTNEVTNGICRGRL
jgi:hypothetical protein